jgi:diadenosine tetraphosphate (Ap4A) HIT family hydrolase
VHWHVIPRFLDDRHYPDPVWAAPRRDSAPVAFDRAALIEGLRMELGDEQDA